VVTFIFGSAGLVGSTCCRWPNRGSPPAPAQYRPAPPTGRRRQPCCVPWTVAQRS